MKTLVIKALDKSNGIHPKSGKYNIHLSKKGNGTGTIESEIVTTVSNVLSINGGKFIFNGVEYSEIIVDALQVVRTHIRVDREEAYIMLNSVGKYNFKEINTDTQDTNSPEVDYTYPINGLYSVSGMFANYKTYNRPITGIIMPSVDVEGMLNFANGASVFNQEVNSLDVSRTKDFSLAFANTLFNKSIDKLNTVSATNMYYMFSNTPFNQPVSTLNISNVTILDGMYFNCRNFDQDISTLSYNVNASMISYLDGSGLSPANYTKFLQKLDSMDFSARTTAKVIGAAGVKYSSTGATARNSLVTKGWTILDSGQA
ncbi:BspA family leucine-rich repeat surface protein [Elizabethkingia anophelis]|nr:BspA family leucine-rich repeat surface protein [Elizabethkingia anophelis]